MENFDTTFVKNIKSCLKKMLCLQHFHNTFIINSK